MPSDTVSSQLFASQKEKKASCNKPCSLEEERGNVDEEIPCATETSKGRCCPKFSFTDGKAPRSGRNLGSALTLGSGAGIPPSGPTCPQPPRGESAHGGKSLRALSRVMAAQLWAQSRHRGAGPEHPPLIRAFRLPWHTPGGRPPLRAWTRNSRRQGGAFHCFSAP